MALSCLPASAQEATFQQRIADLDTKTAALEKRFEENQDRSQKYNSFIEEARANLQKIRADRKPIEPMPSFPEIVIPTSSVPLVAPVAPVTETNPAPSIPPPVSPAPSKPPVTVVKPRESKGYYIQIFGGFVNPDTGSYKRKLTNPTTAKIELYEFPAEHQNGFSSGIVYGRDFGKFRLEGEISGRRFAIESIDFTSYQSSTLGLQTATGYSSAVGGLVTAYYDIQLTESVGFFLGIGTGVSGAMLNIKTVGGAPTTNHNFYRDTLFSYQILTGFAWEFGQRLSSRFVYKYFTTAGSQHFDRLGSHNLELGLQLDM